MLPLQVALCGAGGYAATAEEGSHGAAALKAAPGRAPARA